MASSKHRTRDVPAPNDPTSYAEERIPFDQVLRKLVNTKPPHKTAKPTLRKPKKG